MKHLILLTLVLALAPMLGFSQLALKAAGPGIEPPPCDRNCCVSYWDMPDELNYLMDCDNPCQACNNVLSTSTITLGYGNDNDGDGYDDGWLFHGPSTAWFDCDTQDDMISETIAYAQALAPNCPAGSNLIICYDFFLDFVTCGGCSDYFLGVNITYKCCGPGIIRNDWPVLKPQYLK